MVLIFGAETVAFTGVAAALVAAPGVDFAAVVRNAVYDRHRGILTGFGVVTGLLVHTLAAVVGVAAVLTANEGLFKTLQLVGGMYLLYLGIMTLRKLVGPGGAVPSEHLPPGPSQRVGSRSGFRDGFLVNVLNPKAPVLFLTLLPQFIPSGASPFWQSLFLSLIIVGMGAVWFPMLALFANAAAQKLGTARVQRMLGFVTALVFVALGLNMAVSSWL